MISLEKGELTGRAHPLRAGARFGTMEPQRHLPLGEGEPRRLSYPPEELSVQAFSLYETFRPKIASGMRGRG